MEEEDKENSYLVTPAKSPRVSDEMVDPKLIFLHREQDRRKSDQEMLQTASTYEPHAGQVRVGLQERLFSRSG